MGDGSTHPFLNFNGATVEFREWINVSSVGIPLTKAIDAELWCFLSSVSVK